MRISGAKKFCRGYYCRLYPFRGETILENVPKISDVQILLHIMEQLGAKIHWLNEESVSIEVPDQIEYSARYEEVRSLRASNLLLGSLFGTLWKAEVALPGGCDSGPRPMDLHIKGFSKLGATVETKNDYIQAKADHLTGAFIYLDFPSVGATENIMMAAAMAEGLTTIENVAKEPEIVDLANLLNSAGAKVRGAGTDIIKIEGVPNCERLIIPSFPTVLEAGTFLAAAAMTGST